jgi:hypothetical protein
MKNTKDFSIMRKWYKFDPIPNRSGKITETIDQTYDQHAESMGGFGVDEAYGTVDSLLRKYFFSYQYGRQETSYNFIMKNVGKGDAILSLGSGRSIVEFFLKQQGYLHITCSDLMPSECNKAIDLPFIILNILESPAPKKYDTVICLGIIYLFDNEQLEVFFTNVKKSLTENGILILDSAGASDSLLTHVYHDYYLFLEGVFMCFVNTLRNGNRYNLKTKHFGFIRTNREIIEIARKCGFELENYDENNYENELSMSAIYLRLVKIHGVFKRLFIGLIGVHMPHVRMFKFRVQ